VLGRTAVVGTAVSVTGSVTESVAPPDTGDAETEIHTTAPAASSVQPDGSAEPETVAVTSVDVPSMTDPVREVITPTTDETALVKPVGTAVLVTPPIVLVGAWP
jgi:hypothetical protein